MGSTVAEREAFRLVVQKFMRKNKHLKRSEIIRHFVQLGEARSTMYSVLNKLTLDRSVKERARTGRPSTWTIKRRYQLKRLTNNRCDVSQRKLASKFDVDKSTICRQLKKMSISFRKREKTPKYTNKQAKKSRILSRKLRQKINSTKPEIVMDDEKYFTFASLHHKGYYTNDKNSCPDNVRFLGKEKYPPKLLMWIALSRRGMSTPFFLCSKSQSVNKNVYISECLEKRLLPFVREKHRDGRYLFWPDLARAHTAKASIEWMKANVNFVPVEVNPPNVPQARPIEDFWGCLSQKVYEGGWEAQTSDQLIRRIKQKLTEFEPKFFHRLFSGVEKKLNKIGREGVLAPFKK